MKVNSLKELYEAIREAHCLLASPIPRSRADSRRMRILVDAIEEYEGVHYAIDDEETK